MKNSEINTTIEKQKFLQLLYSSQEYDKLNEQLKDIEYSKYDLNFMKFYDIYFSNEFTYKQCKNLLQFSKRKNYQHIYNFLLSQKIRVYETFLDYCIQNDLEEIKAFIQNKDFMQFQTNLIDLGYILAYQYNNMRVVKYLRKYIYAKQRTKRKPKYSKEKQQKIKILLKYGADINKKNKYENTPFMKVWLRQQLDLIKLFIKYSKNTPDYNTQNRRGDTPFIVSCRENNIKSLKILLEQERCNDNITIDKQHENKYGHIGFQQVCTNGNLKMAQTLIQYARQDTNNNKKYFNINQQNRDKATAFHQACNTYISHCNNKYKKIVNSLISKKYIINELQYAYEYEKYNIIKLLKNNSVDTQLKDRIDNTGFTQACISNSVGILSLVIDSKTDINQACNTKGTTGLMFACFEDKYQILDVLISKQVDINKKRKDNATAYTICCQENSTKSLERLLQLKHLDTKNGRAQMRHTGLTIACYKNNIEIIKLLSKYNIDLNEQNDQKESGLIVACRQNNYGIVHFLLQNQVDIEIQNDNLDTALSIACKKSHKDIISLLIQFKANINCENIQGDTPYIIACKKRKEDIIEILIKSGSNTQYINKEGKIGLDYLDGQIKQKILYIIDKHQN